MAVDETKVVFSEKRVPGRTQVVIFRHTFLSQRTGELVKGYAGDIYLDGKKVEALGEFRTCNEVELAAAKYEASCDRALDHMGIARS